MKSNKSPCGLTVRLAILVIAVLAGTQAFAQQETILYNANSTTWEPNSSLIFDSAGNLYGTSAQGAVWQLLPQTDGTWIEQTLYSFGLDLLLHLPENPGGPLLLDSSGNLYGTTAYGGLLSEGVVYELVPDATGEWALKSLHTFGQHLDGAAPNGGLIFDAAGSIYGTTSVGGTYSTGTVFQLIPQSNGHWTEKLLHQFGNATDGQYPSGGVIFGTDGNLYGTTSYGGFYASNGSHGGTVFELIPQSNGTWKEKILHNFGNSTDGNQPANLISFDGSGNLYGITQTGGAYNLGTAYQLVPQPDGSWKENILHNFGNGTDGYYPNGVTLDSAGNLYGTTESGGIYAETCAYNKGGTLFELLPSSSGAWTEQSLHSFCQGTDGAQPFAGVTLDSAGNLYGTTYNGGLYYGPFIYGGAVYKFAP
jgi:hypothetical protein